MRVNWKEIFIFLSGMAGAKCLVDLYLYLSKISVPFIGYTFSPNLIGIKTVIDFVFFALFYYLGFIKMKD